MPRREFARTGTDMPEERSIKSLDVEPQWLYDRLRFRPEISRCGVVPFRPAVWADLGANATEPKVRKWLRALINGRQVVVDERYAEVFVRTFVRHDGLLAQPNVVANMCSDYSLIASDTIRLAFLAEFRRIWDVDLKPAERGGWLLAVGVLPKPKPDGDRGAAWPEYMPAAGIERLRKAIRDTGILGPFIEAIRDGHVDPFTEASPAGLPEPLATASPNPSPKGHVRGRAPSTATSNGYEQRATVTSNDSVVDLDHQNQPDVTRATPIGLGASKPFTDEPPF